jgi:hypothetical protein
VTGFQRKRCLWLCPVLAGAVLKILRRALDGWDALESDLAHVAGPGMQVFPHCHPF